MVSLTGGRGTAAIARRYPNEDGLTAETTKQEGHIEGLIPEESNIPNNQRAGLD